MTGTVTDRGGGFALRAIPSGTSQGVASRVGYQAGVPPGVSSMLMQEPFTRLDTSGNLLTPFAIALAGDWAGSRVSDLLHRF